MKMKRKIIAIWVILLLIAIPFGIAQASETNEQEQNNETIPVEIATFEEGIPTTEKVILSEEELVEFENTISALIDKIQSVTNWEGLKDIINGLLGSNALGIFSIFRSLLSRLLPGRTYVISSGHGYKFNPFKKSSIKIRKKLSFWHYSSGEILKDRTIILKPLALKIKVLKGLQFGFMTKFTGIYIYVARKLPEKSYTFFMGMAQRANGIQLPFGK